MYCCDSGLGGLLGGAGGRNDAEDADGLFPRFGLGAGPLNDGGALLINVTDCPGSAVGVYGGGSSSGTGSSGGSTMLGGSGCESERDCDCGFLLGLLDGTGGAPVLDELAPLVLDALNGLLLDHSLIPLEYLWGGMLD